MNNKICKKCGEEFPATMEFFDKKKDGKYGFKARCKRCIKIYRAENKENISEYLKQYREANKEKIAEYQKQYREANKDNLTEYNKRYLKANKEKIYKIRKQHYAKWRAAKLNQTPEYSNLSLIHKIYENCPDGYHVDHMTPLSKGGLHHESNLCYLPASVNTSKGGKRIEEFGTNIFLENVIYWQDILTK